jgi:hypothetical protein
MAVHQDKKKSKEGWRDISRSDIKWIDVMVHLQDKKRNEPKLFQETTKNKEIEL